MVRVEIFLETKENEWQPKKKRIQYFPKILHGTDITFNLVRPRL